MRDLSLTRAYTVYAILCKQSKVQSKEAISNWYCNNPYGELPLHPGQAQTTSPVCAASLGTFCQHLCYDSCQGHVLTIKQQKKSPCFVSMTESLVRASALRVCSWIITECWIQTMCSRSTKTQKECEQQRRCNTGKCGGGITFVDWFWI